MRESNFAFPAQNRASVSISSQLYDRRALDTNSPLPLFNSLTHLTYLTSTSPRIREIMTYDGGLERLVQILRDFCLHPPPPENPTLMYGLSPTPLRPPRRTPALNPTPFDKHAAYRFSLAFQSIVNIGVRGSEEIRGRVVQAGTLDVVGCILEAWLAGKGYAIGPSASTAGLHRETREQRLARRAAQAEARQRHQAAELERALRRQADIQERLLARQAAENTRQLLQQGQHTEGTVTQENGPGSASASETNSDTEASATITPGGETPTAVVTVPGRERSGTVIGRPVWEQGTIRGRRVSPVDQPEDSSADASRAETETEDDGDGDVDMDRSVASEASSPAPSRTSTIPPHVRRAVGIVEDAPEAGPSTASPSNPPHIIVDSDTVVAGGVGVADGLVALEQNDDFALGAPPGAPGAIDGVVPAPTAASPAVERLTRMAPDVTPRAMEAALPAQGTQDFSADFNRMQEARGGPHQRATIQPLPANTQGNPNAAVLAYLHQHHHDHYPRSEGPYRDEDVLLGLQLLAYLSKYPHVRQAFYKPRTSFHPAAATTTTTASTPARPSTADINSASPAPVASSSTTERSGFFRALATVRGKDKRASTAPLARPEEPTAQQPQRMMNVFSLVERFTFRPSSSESELPGAPPPIPPEIQYWAGVIMRNACRKDDTRGGIRQCANMLCGRWETYPREFAKCRRCRKAKYCGKECQSTAWSEGHRFWCSAKDAEEDAAHAAHARAEAHAQRVVITGADGTAATMTVTTAGGPVGQGPDGLAVTDEQVSAQTERVLAAMRQAFEVDRADTARPNVDITAELLQRMGTDTLGEGNAGPTQVTVAGAAQATWGWDRATIRAPAGVPEDVPVGDVNDLFVDPLLQHGMFGTGAGIMPTAGGMRVEDGVVRLDDDIVRMRPRAASDVTARTTLPGGAGVEDAMVLD